MYSPPPWLGIDYGSAYTKAVLVTPSGAPTLLRLDGDHLLSNAVHVGSGEILVGAPAWQRADADGFIACPLQAGDGPVAGVGVDPADLVAATLRRVAGEAAAVAGARVEDVRMVVPAGWGPRRRTWWRQVAGKAGLGQVRLVESPVAVLDQLVGGRGDAAWRCLVVDVGAGCEVTVVRRVPGAGLEVLATMADADAGGNRIDAAMVEAVLGAGVDELPVAQRWLLLASARAAKPVLAQQPAVAMAVPGRPPVVISTMVLREAAQPVFDRVATLAADVVRNADVTLEDLDAVYAVGAPMAAPGAAEMIAGKLGVAPQVPDQPGFVAVLGAAEVSSLSTSDAPVDSAARAGVPPLRRLVGLGLPGVLSLVLYAHFVFGAEFRNTSPGVPRRYYYVLASWGELTVAAVLALLTCLQAAVLIGAVLHGRPGGGRQRLQQPGGQVTSGLGAAAVAAVAVAGLYAVTAAVYFAKPVGGLLRWSVVPLLPAAVCAGVLAVVAWRSRSPAGGWDAFLAFPVSSYTAAAAGTFVVTQWWSGRLPAWLAGWDSALGYLGGALLGIAVACALARPVGLRLGLSLFLGFLSVILSRSGPGILAVIYALAVAAWWGHRSWTLFRLTRTGPGLVSATSPGR